jgi:hypothetical protein
MEGEKKRDMKMSTGRRERNNCLEKDKNEKTQQRTKVTKRTTQ